MKSICRILLPLAGIILLASACKKESFGANPYDPSTPVTVSEWPKVLSFTPEKGQAGDVITITGSVSSSVSGAGPSDSLDMQI